MQFAEIYGLFDPDTHELRYIGKANNSAKRFIGHLREIRRKTPLYFWIEKLRNQGKQPTMRVLEICPYEDWERSERQHIFEARLMGERLLNVASGGNEPKSSLETNRKNGEKSKGHKGATGLVNELIRRMGRRVADRKKRNMPYENYLECQTILRNMSTSVRERFTIIWLIVHPHDKIYEDRKTISVQS